jgi:hypothetical protein
MIDDIASVIALTQTATDPQQVYKQVENIAAETCGWILLTTLKYVESENSVERLHSSDPVSHAIGGRKPLDKLGESHGNNSSDGLFHAATKADVRRAFYDHELILSLGIGSILNAPITHVGNRLGTLNFCGTENMYGPAEIQAARILAGLLVPTLLLELRQLA